MDKTNEHNIKLNIKYILYLAVALFLFKRSEADPSVQGRDSASKKFW